jgi:glycosyltransferase involved in cell wall biosynthesis
VTAPARSSTPLVSVVVSTYKRPVMLRETLRSVLEGEFEDFEILVGNDGEAEDIADVRRELDDPRIRWLHRAERLGMLRNNLDGFARARGVYVANLHDDDVWTPHFLSTLVPPMQDDPAVVLAFCDHFIMDEHGVLLEHQTEEATRAWGRSVLAPGKHQPFWEIGLVNQSISFGCSSLFRRSAMPLDRFPDEIGPAYDVWATYQLAKTEQAAWYDPNRLVYYRSHPASQTGSGRRTNAAAQIFMFSRFLEEPRLAPWRDVFRRRLAQAETALGVEHLLSGEKAEGRACLRRGARLRPTPRNAALAVGGHVAPALLSRISTARAARRS